MDDGSEWRTTEGGVGFWSRDERTSAPRSTGLLRALRRVTRDDLGLSAALGRPRDHLFAVPRDARPLGGTDGSRLAPRRATAARLGNADAAAQAARGRWARRATPARRR